MTSLILADGISKKFYIPHGKFVPLGGTIGFMVGRRTKNARTRTRRSTEPKLDPSMSKYPHAFLPNLLDQVKAIAMQGLGDDEMAALFGIPQDQFAKWKDFYPSFAKAIEAGRTQADAEVVVALFKSAVGYSHLEEKVFYDSNDGSIIRADTTRHYAPNLPSIKLWLTNRKKDQWKDRSDVRVGGSNRAGDDDAPIGVRDETKLELMSSILSLIRAKPDQPAKSK